MCCVFFFLLTLVEVVVLFETTLLLTDFGKIPFNAFEKNTYHGISMYFDEYVEDCGSVSIASL